MNEPDERALWQVRQTQVLEAKLKMWTTFIVFMSLWATLIAVLWKAVIL